MGLPKGCDSDFEEDTPRCLKDCCHHCCGQIYEQRKSGASSTRFNNIPRRDISAQNVVVPKSEKCIQTTCAGKTSEGFSQCSGLQSREPKVTVSTVKEKSCQSIPQGTSCQDDYIPPQQQPSMNKCRMMAQLEGGPPPNMCPFCKLGFPADGPAEIRVFRSPVGENCEFTCKGTKFTRMKDGKVQVESCCSDESVKKSTGCCGGKKKDKKEKKHKNRKKSH